MHLPYKLLLCIGFSLNIYAVQAQLYINEIMQSNVDCIMDDLNEFPDSWVELYNASSTSESLGNYRLGILPNYDEAWQFPDSLIAPHTFILIYCDKVGEGLHTNFRLESGKGGNIYLFKNICIDSLTNLPKQPAPNISYGREYENSSNIGYQLEFSPGKPNCGRVVTSKTILGNPKYDVLGGVFSKDLTLQISPPKDSPVGTTIHYTLDGSEPTIESLLYESPLSISKTTIIRAKAFCDGYLSPRSVTQSYIYHPREMTLPVISLVTDSVFFYDQHIGIYTRGNYDPNKENYQYNWRRPVNFEYFVEPEKGSVLNQLCETRILGGTYTRPYKIKSLALYSHKRFGDKNLKFEFFPDDKPGLNKFKSLILRNAGNDFLNLYLRDAIIQRVMGKHVDLDWQAYQPAILYINGEYNGIINIRERSNEDHIYSNYGIEDIDMIENWTTLKKGDNDAFNLFRDFYLESGHSYNEYKQLMDCGEFMNLMIMNIYFNNQDFPANNVIVWKPKNDEGRWRFVAKDTDFGLGLYNREPRYNTINWLYDLTFDTTYKANYEYGTILFRHLMEDESFKKEFIDRTLVYLGDFLNKEMISNTISPMYEAISGEYEYHQKLFNSNPSTTYRERLDYVYDWIESRTEYMYDMFKDWFELNDFVSTCIFLSKDSTSSNYYINDISLTEKEFYGKFPQGMTLNISCDGSNSITKDWEITEIDETGHETRANISGSSLLYTIPNCQSVLIEEKTTETGIINHGSDRCIFALKDGTLYMDNVKEGTIYKLFNVNGIKLKEGTLSHHTNITGLKKNVIYLLQLGEKCIKLIEK